MESTRENEIFHKMHISTISRIPKTIWGIVAAISTAVFGFILPSSAWFWICWEVVAAALVAIGCFGEWYLFKTPATPGDEGCRRGRELQFILVVAIGVTMEFLALSHAIPEALRLERDVELARANNLVLKSNVAALELQIAQTSTNVANIDPLNQPIASLTASVSLANLGTNRTNIDPSKPLGGAAFVKLRFACSKHAENGWVAVLTCISCETSPLTTSDNNRAGTCCLLEFGSSGMGHLLSVIPPKTSVRDANEWDSVEFDAPFLPPGTEIIGGDIILTVNSTKKRFEIPPQKIQKVEDIPLTKEQKEQGLIKSFRFPVIAKSVTLVSW